MRSEFRRTVAGSPLQALACGLSLAFAVVALPGCSNKAPPSTPAAANTAATTPAASPAPAEQAQDVLPPYVSPLPVEIASVLDKPFTGDLEEMVKRRLIRVGVPFSRTLYFGDRGEQHGAAYEYGKLIEEEMNKRRKTGNLKIHFWFVPLPREQLLPALVAGKVDFVIGQLTDTPERRKLVDFTNPTRRNVSEVVVTGPDAPPIATVDDLSGKEVYVRKESSYYQSLMRLNERLHAAGKPLVDVQEAPGNLEDDDLLEMANAGLIKITIVDDYLAKFWSQVFPKITVHDKVAVRTGGTLGVALRKNSPQLLAGLNAVIAKYGLGSAFGNQMQKRYFENTSFIKNSTADAERKRFEQMASYFKKYSDQYGLDYLLMAAQGFQESGLDQNVKSRVGAVGVMQVMPATGKDLEVGDIRQLEPNIHAGVKYMHYLMDRYFKDEPMDALNKGLFTFAAYNAGPARIAQLRKETAKRGLDPNVWFGNVEVVTSERIGRETVTYVSNIYKYYVAYTLAVHAREQRTSAKEALGAGARPVH